jgi:hypothetical protein
VIDRLALTVVVLTGLYLIGLAVATVAAPERAARFLAGLAGSAALHYLELAVRLLVGAAFIIQAPRLPYARAFTVFGGMLVLTTVGLCLVPWQAHRRFAERSVPPVLRYLPLLGGASLVAGVSVLVAAWRGA